MPSALNYFDLEYVKTTIAAMEKFMETTVLKKSKMGSFNAYFNQPFPKIGTENYDM